MSGNIRHPLTPGVHPVFGKSLGWFKSQLSSLKLKARVAPNLRLTRPAGRLFLGLDNVLVQTVGAKLSCLGWKRITKGHVRSPFTVLTRDTYFYRSKIVEEMFLVVF